MTKTLGVVWIVQDKFSFSFVPPSDELVLTKRNMLKKTASIYDPFGFLTPFVVRAKILMQEAWMEAFGWDEELPDRFKMEWKRWFEELGELGAVRISRCLKEDKKLRDVTIHTFSVASEKAYVAASYIRHEYFKRLRHCGILRTFRGCRAGRALKLRNLLGSSNIQSVHQSSQICIPISSRSPHSPLFLSNTICSGGRRSGSKVKQREFGQKSPISTVITHREHEYSPRQRGIRTNNLTRIQPHSRPIVVEKSLLFAVINCRSLNKNGIKLKDHIVETL